MLYDFLGHHHMHSDIKLKFKRGRLPQIEASRIWFRLRPPAGSALGSERTAVDALVRIERAIRDLRLSPAYVSSKATPQLLAYHWADGGIGSTALSAPFWLNSAIVLVLFVVVAWLLLYRISSSIVFAALLLLSFIVSLGVMSYFDLKPDNFIGL